MCKNNLYIPCCWFINDLILIKDKNKRKGMASKYTHDQAKQKRKIFPWTLIKTNTNYCQKPWNMKNYISYSYDWCVHKILLYPVHTQKNYAFLFFVFKPWLNVLFSTILPSLAWPKWKYHTFWLFPLFFLLQMKMIFFQGKVNL